MNPFLEQEDVWQDFHDSFIPAARAALTVQIAPKYLVLIEEYLFVHEYSAVERLVIGKGDLALSRGPAAATIPHPTSALIAPARARFPTAFDVEKHTYLEIRGRDDEELITVIELLSPSNKRAGPDRELYLAKRRQIQASPVHLVEIDLLRGYSRLPLEDLPDCDYYVLLSRAEDRPDVEVWPLRLREVLPTVPIPLRSPDPAAQLDLQLLLHRIYDEAGYAYRLYRGKPHPRLHPNDSAWADQILREHGLLASPPT
jgi:hypothetical protein